MRYLTLFGFLISGCAFAQQADSLAQVYLKEVQVYGMPVMKYAAGAKVESVAKSDATILLDEALNDKPSVYFKTYGNTQLSTISFRGTSASHTAVLWNGMNINPPTLGQTDFSLLPIFLLDDISVQSGTSSSLYGSDALGGSVLISASIPKFERGMNFLALQEVGSFGDYFSGVKLGLGMKRWEVRSKVMYHTMENNFPYTSPAVGHKKEQNNASVKQYGVDQQVHYRIREDRWLSLEVLHTHNLREVQPAVTNDHSDETLEDTNTRASLSYHGRHKAGEVYASTGYAYNDQVFNEDSCSRSDQITALFNVDKTLTSRVNIRYGASGTMFLADVDGYGGFLREHRYDVFASLHWWLLPSWNISVNMRQSLYDGRYAPFAPSVGTSYRLTGEKQNPLTLRFQISRGYRIPTLNDRYWTPGGKADLKPEQAWHVEGGLEWKKTKSRQEITAAATAYTIRTDQWIIWLPTEGGFWSPSNLQKVNAYGLETEVKHTLKFDNVLVKSGLAYSYTRSVNEKGLTPADKASVNNQLPYVPFHTARFYTDVRIGTWQATLNVDYTGLRYTTLDNEEYQSLEGYVLGGLSIAKKIEMNKWSFTGKGKVGNLFNVYYENIQNRAMPGIHYSLTLIGQFQQKP